MSKEIQTIQEDGRGLAKLDHAKGSIFSSLQSLEEATKIATVLSNSSLVPDAYKKNVPNTLLALEMANRFGGTVTPFQVMQNLDIIFGVPSWKSKFEISLLRSCGRFKNIGWEWHRRDDDSKVDLKRNDDQFGCRMVATSVETGKELKGTWITWAMVRAEGWDKRKDKRGNIISKWPTMPEQMFQYRSASFFADIHAPDLLNGLNSVDEVLDVTHQEVQPTADETEQGRVKDWIYRAKTLDELNQVKDELGENEELKELFEDKKKQLEDGAEENKS